MDPQAQAAAPPPPPGFVPLNPDSSQAGGSNTPAPPPGFVPLDGSAAPAAPAVSAPAAGSGEGLYGMTAPDGRPVQIPYSKVHTQIQNGYLFADKPTLQQYARDLAADPLHEDRVDQFLEKHPWIGAPVNGLLGAGTGVLKLVTGLDKTPTTRGETELQLAAARPTKGASQAGGEAAENVAEFFGGDELLSLLGKGAEGLGIAEKLKNMTGMAQLLEKYPMLAKLAKIGSTAVKQGTIAGGQTFVKSGGDIGAAATAAGETALASGALSAAGATGAAIKTARAGVPAAEAAAPVEKEVAGVRIPVGAEAANATATPQAAKSAEAYGALSRQAIEEKLKAVADSPRQLEQALNSTHDLTGAAERSREMLNPIYDDLNESTDGRFRELNKEVGQAQKLSRTGKPEDVAAYQNKLREMDDLLDKVPSWAGRKEQLAAVKAAWRQTYILDDFAGSWDRNLNGAPGASKVSQEQRGINGNRLMDDIQRTIKTYGRAHVEEGLGADRLEQWENIARWNQTNAKRQAFNLGVQEVGKNLNKPTQMSEFGKRAASMVAGGAAAHVVGASPYMGMLAGEATYESTRVVLNAIKTNPKIAQNFMFALESGATAKRYGPFIAEMIQKSQTDKSDEQQTANRE
jgi:hypothetical protein